MIVFVLVISAVVAIYKKMKKNTLEKSEFIKELVSVNEKVKYKNVKPLYTFEYLCSSRREFNRYTLEEYLVDLITDDTYLFEKIINGVAYNKKRYGRYVDQVERIRQSAAEAVESSTLFDKVYKKCEDGLLKKTVLKKPTVDTMIDCRITYITPTGRSKSWCENRFSYNELKKAYEKTIKLKESKEKQQRQIEYERSKMTSSLRYDILRRDGFRCQLCGSTADDGVKLHIDHIVPVSKGGRTEKSNLRVLCDRCNFGKRDKIEETNGEI
ncbi:MAG: HNH endonuclease [Clostridia bacterium]|nr:HNH endonuclease [Clostridia bacterium]